MEFERKQLIESSLAKNRALVIYGPRRIGKTTLLNKYLKKQSADKRVLSVIGDDIRIRELFASEIRDAILDFAKPYDVIAIDEAQRVPRIGLGVKMIIDAFPEKTLILTGSSSFDLSSQVGEPLTGRHFTLTLLPIAQAEMKATRFELTGALESRILYGSYPEVLTAHDSAMRERILHELVASYLYKDALALDKIKSPDLLKDIAKMLAFQVGNEVSLNEIAVALKTDVKTVGRYLDVLEKMFVIKKVRGFSRNLRNEITKKSKYYFLDLGVRNAVISQFSPFGNRNDIGALWENFVFMEFLKQSVISQSADNYYFWRTHTGVEIDIIRESHGKLTAIECKWSNVKAKIPKLWHATYPESDFVTITKDIYFDYFKIPDLL